MQRKEFMIVAIIRLRSLCVQTIASDIIHDCNSAAVPCFSVSSAISVVDIFIIGQQMTANSVIQTTVSTYENTTGVNGVVNTGVNGVVNTAANGAVNTAVNFQGNYRPPPCCAKDYRVRPLSSQARRPFLASSQARRRRLLVNMI